VLLPVLLESTIEMASDLFVLFEHSIPKA
jgi:hypothetical protein